MTHWQDAFEQIKQLFNYERVGLITDMDGTISPIVPVPSDAKPTEQNRSILQQLHKQLTLVAVVSGRAVADVRERVDLPELTYVGNHGLERWKNNQVILTPQAAPCRSNLEAAAAQIKTLMPTGMWVEDKQATLSIHYRDTENPQQTAQRFAPHQRLVEARCGAVAQAQLLRRDHQSAL